MAFYQEQQRFMSASGLLVRDHDGSVIMVKPHYKVAWQLPGGFVEADESPTQAAEREVEEELGLHVICHRLLCVDFKSANGERPACVQFVFDGGILPAEALARIVLPPDELESWAAVSAAEAPKWAEPGGPASRLRFALDALDSGATFYLEDGRFVRSGEGI